MNKIHKLHNRFIFNDDSEITENLKCLPKVNEINYYFELIHNRFDIFTQKCKIFMNTTDLKNVVNIYKNIDNIAKHLSTYPLTFCHGDMKSPNIFYKNDDKLYFLDWQYTHIGKGVSDIAFLLVESILFDKNTVDIVVKYYFKLVSQKNKKIDYEQYLFEFKCSLCMFPFFVCVWFNSEDSDKHIDKSFPMRFMKNLLKYYNYYIDDDFFIKCNV